MRRFGENRETPKYHLDFLVSFQMSELVDEQTREVSEVRG